MREVVIASVCVPSGRVARDRAGAFTLRAQWNWEDETVSEPSGPRTFLIFCSSQPSTFTPGPHRSCP